RGRRHEKIRLPPHRRCRVPRSRPEVRRHYPGPRRGRSHDHRHADEEHAASGTADRKLVRKAWHRPGASEAVLELRRFARIRGHAPTNKPMRLAVLNIVGLSKSLLGLHMPRLSAFAERAGLQSYRPAFPAVTCTAQSSIVTGATP